MRNYLQIMKFTGKYMSPRQAAAEILMRRQVNRYAGTNEQGAERSKASGEKPHEDI